MKESAMTAKYEVVLMNMRDGSVQGHAAGCADLKRGVKKFAEAFQADEVWEVKDREEARAEYNADFDEETDGWYDITWLPCAKDVPNGGMKLAETKTGLRKLAPEQLDSPTVSNDHTIVGPKGGAIIQVDVEGRTIYLRKADAVKLARQLNTITGTKPVTGLNR